MPSMLEDHTRCLLNAWVASLFYGLDNVIAVTDNNQSSVTTNATIYYVGDTPNHVLADLIFYVIVACLGTLIIGISIILVLCYCSYRRDSKEASEFDYTASMTSLKNGSVNMYDTFPSPERKLAQSAQMYHYEYQKQQIIDAERAKRAMPLSESDGETDDDSAEDYTIFECPGLASHGEMEVSNPSFNEDKLIALSEEQIALAESHKQTALTGNGKQIPETVMEPAGQIATSSGEVSTDPVAAPVVEPGGRIVLSETGETEMTSK